jgi:hypothetical protein
MGGARTLTAVFVLDTRAAGGALPPHSAAACEAMLGQWTWLTGGIVSINADGTMAHEPGNDGTWECKRGSGQRLRKENL